MMSSLTAWIVSAIMFGTVIMFGALGEILTEKSGHLNLGVPGIMFLGGFSGWAVAFLYERKVENPNALFMILLPIVVSFAVGGIGELLYAFLVTTLRANQNVTGLALTKLGVGIASFGGAYVLIKSKLNMGSAPETFDLLTMNLHDMLGLEEGTAVYYISKMFLSHGFLTYLAILLAVGMSLFFKKTKTGLNLRSIGENPATADAAGINVTKYKYLSNIVGGGICGVGGMFYVLNYANGVWSTNNNIESLGWLAVALVIFATWKPVNAIWGSYLFAFLFWANNFMSGVFGIVVSLPVKDLLQMLPYVVTIVVLIVTSLRNKRENQPPAALGLSYFREDR